MRTPGNFQVVGMEKAEIPEPYCKKAPRIISRSRLRPTNDSNKKDEKESVKNDFELDDEVGEGFVVRGGVMMRIADLNKEQWKPMKRFYIDVNRSQIYHNVRDDVSLGNDSTSPRVTVEVSALPGDGGMFHLCDNLPGVANEVESYPCRYCPNRIFLTSFGLERHTEMEHKAHLPEVMEEISRIHNEWRRREAFRAIAKKRREALKKTRMLTEVVRRSQDLRSESSADRHHTKGFDCHICGVRFEANWELMMNHFRAHRRNNDLRRRLLADFGPEYVARCTCHHCHLVFVNEKNLVLHKESSHVRKRKYVCKWCGDVCLSMNELNEHKKDVHRVSYSRPYKSSVFNTVKLSQKKADGNTMQKKKTSRSGVADTSTRNRTSFLIQNPCIAKCSECGLTTVKPSLLIRHMQRVHNKNCFSAMIEMRGLPDIRVDMDRGKVTWWCCNYSFEDRHRFIHHRKSCHQQFLEHSHLQNQPVDNKGEIITKQGTNNGEVMNTGQILQLISHDGTQNDELYVLVGEEGDLEQNIGIVMGEARTRESLVDSSQQITLTAKEFMHLRQQVAENFDGGMQLFLVDDVNDSQQSSPNSGMEPAVDFIANNMVDSDALNSLLVSGTQIPPANDNYSDARSTDSEFSVVNVPDPTEDEMSQNNLSLPSENLVNLETSSAGLSVPTITFNRGSIMDNSLNHHFQIQRHDLNEITAVPAITISNIARQIYDDAACSSTTLCPEMDGITRSTSRTFPSLIVISNKVTVTSPSNIDYCTVRGSKSNGFLEGNSNRSASVLDSIPTLLDLDHKDTLTTSTAAKLVEISSLQHLPPTIVNENTVFPFINQDTNSGHTNLHKTTIYNL